ncbi:MAG: FAD-dependent oxidoreductase [Candidatus Nitrosopolaris sp.]
MNDVEKSTGQQPVNEAVMPSRPQKFQPKLLEKISHHGTDITSFRFARSDEQRNYYLNYKAGQYSVVDLGTKEDPEGPVRSFTIASSPTEKDFILISTRMRDTLFKKKFASLDLGTLVKITAPMGKFVLPDDHSSKSVVFLSGGIGVTPFRSMVKYATDKQLPLKITVFDSNRDQGNILYKKEFDECVGENKNLKIIYIIADERQESSFIPNDDWKGERGFINKAMLVKYLSTDELDNSIYYICGPPGMLKAMQKLLQDDLHLPKERIKIEEFIGY